MLDLFKVYVSPDLDSHELDRILRSGQLTGARYVRLLEEELRRQTGNPYLLVTSNNNIAALIAYCLAGLKAGDEVIASPLACLATNMPALQLGASIRWADVDPRTGTLSPDDVRRKVSSRTKVILHYHWAGYPGHIDEINRIGRDHNITVIEDATEAYGSIYRGRHVGNLGTDITLFSLQTVRLPSGIDGGALAFRDKELFERAERCRDWGIDRNRFRDEFGEIAETSDIVSTGFNGVMSEPNAFVALSAAIRTPELLALQRQNAARWDIICECSNATPLRREEGSVPNYWVYSFLSADRDAWFLRLRQSGVWASRLHLRNDGYTAFGGKRHQLPGVNEFAARTLCVPSGWWINPSDVTAAVPV